MLAIINKFNDDEVTPMMLDDDAWFVTHAFNGNDELQFTFSEESGYYDLLEEESKVLAIGLRGRSNRFVVKNVDSHDGIVTVNCDVDLYDWQQTIFDTYGGGSARTLEKVLQDVTPSGWSYSGQEQFGKSEVFQTGSREPVKAGTPLDVLDLACEVYGCVFNFDNIANHLYVIDPESYTPSGDFLSDEVNLKSVGYVGNSEGYATRLYPYGKRDDNGENPVTIESVNGGLPYVTNNEFSDDIICVGWSDERYTYPEHLKEAAIARLAEIAVPTRSYECDVSQLNRNVWLYMILTMIDRKHRTRVDQQVVEWKEYGRPDLDVVTLSAVAPSLESLLKSADTDDDAIYQYVNGIASDLTNAYEEAIENATDKITGNDGGYFQWIFDAEGRPVELVNLGDSKDINSAQKVWRWNQSGLGHSNDGYNGSYGLALLADGSINASVITTGILQSSQSYWNMNTGDLSMQGDFQTWADDTYNNEQYGVKISSDYSLGFVGNNNRVYGAGITFNRKYVDDAGADTTRSILPQIAVGMYQKNEDGTEYPMQNVWLTTGSLEDDDPMVSLTANTTTLGSMKNAYVTFICSSDYAKEGGSDEVLLYFSADKANSNGSSQGKVYGRFFAVSADGVRKIGVQPELKNSSGSNVNGLFMGGKPGILTGNGSFCTAAWTGLSLNAWVVAGYDVTVSSPSSYGAYGAVANAQLPNGASNMHAAWVNVANASASGWTVFFFSPPDFVMGKRTSGATASEYKLWNGSSQSAAIYTLGYLR